jgi:hypothetical protein
MVYLSHCASNGVCAMKASAGLCSDGEPSTLGDACQQGACAPGVPTFCEDGNACTNDKCLNGFGCVHEPKDASACDDANPCTSDLCQPAAGCVHGYLTGACNDQSPCTTGDACKDRTCGGNAMACDDKKTLVPMILPSQMRAAASTCRRDLLRWQRVYAGGRVLARPMQRWRRAGMWQRQLPRQK